MSAVEIGAEATSLPAARPEQPAGRSTAWWGMVMLITTEAAFFACLLASYFYLRFASFGPWPPGEIEHPKLVRPLIMTALLIPSSLPMAWADRQIRKGRTGRTALGVALVLAMGAAFLVLQGFEYAEKLRSFTVSTNVYGSLFYAITGFHGLHVVVGLMMMVFLLVGLARRRIGARRYERVQLIALYWHFVDAVWVFILFSIYLSPHL
jgi:cytochrome c oxidase subunit III